MQFEFNHNLNYRISTSKCSQTSISVMKFPGGEVGVNINAGSNSQAKEVKRVQLTARIRSSDDLMAMFLATDAIRREFSNAKVHLFMPYVPYARQDRVCNPGEALSIKVLAQLVNSQDYETVTILDPHSSVTPALIERVIVVDQYELFANVKLDWSETIIIAPDAGASKKTEDFAKRVGARGVLQFNKKREMSTGKILGIEPIGELDCGGKYMVLDDILDGGRTFIELAKVFDSTHAQLDIMVTHGIFSQGVEVITRVYDKVYTTDSLCEGWRASGNLIVKEFKPTF